MRWIWPLAILVGVLLVTRQAFGAVTKAGVAVRDALKPTTRRIVEAAEYAFGRQGVRAVITSAEDGTHRADSRHYTGDALDFRRWDTDAKGPGVTAQVAADMRAFLGADYDVVVEVDHIHVEYDPKG